MSTSYRFGKFSFLLFILPGLSSLPVASQPFQEVMDAEPVNFTDKRSSLQNRIQFPDIAGAVHVRLLCNGMVNEKGRFFTQVVCIPDKRVEQSYTPQQEIQEASRTIEVDSDVLVTEVNAASANWIEERFEREVVEASRRSKLEPARYQGRKVVANVNFSVEFTQKTDEKEIEVFLHHFNNVDGFGRDYIAAQGIGYKLAVTSEGRPVNCPTINNPVVIKATVDTGGEAKNVSVSEVVEKNEVMEETYEVCLPAYVNLVESTLFIPALSNGRFVSSYYTALFFDPVYEEHVEDDFKTDDEVTTEKLRDFQNRVALPGPRF